MTGLQLRCAYALANESHHRCLLREVARAAGGKTPKCSNCADGRPRRLTAEQRARYEQSIKDGWRNADGSYCDRELYVEALAKNATPAQILRARVGEA